MKIFAFGKLNIKKTNNIIICAVIIVCKINSFLLIKRRKKFIIKICMPSKPLKPSIKFDPLIIKRKQRIIKIIIKILFVNHKFKNCKSTFPIINGDILRERKIKMIIEINRVKGLIEIFKSSISPTKNKL